MHLIKLATCPCSSTTEELRVSVCVMFAYCILSWCEYWTMAMISAGLHTNPSNPSKATLVETKLSVSPFIKIYRFGGAFFFCYKIPCRSLCETQSLHWIDEEVLRRMFCTVSAAKSPANTRRGRCVYNSMQNFIFLFVCKNQSSWWMLWTSLFKVTVSAKGAKSHRLLLLTSDSDITMKLRLVVQTKASSTRRWALLIMHFFSASG